MCNPRAGSAMQVPRAAVPQSWEAQYRRMCEITAMSVLAKKFVQIAWKTYYRSISPAKIAKLRIAHQLQNIKHIQVLYLYLECFPLLFSILFLSFILQIYVGIQGLLKILLTCPSCLRVCVVINPTTCEICLTS